MGLFRKKKKPEETRSPVTVPIPISTTASSAFDPTLGGTGVVYVSGGAIGSGGRGSAGATASKIEETLETDPPLVEIIPPAKPLPKVDIYVCPDKGDSWRWRLKKGNNKNFGASGESFSSRANALRAANSLSALIPGSTVHVENPDKKKPAPKKAPVRKAK